MKPSAEGGIMAKLLWKPSEEQIKNSNMYRFMNIINEKYHQNFSEYASLYEWSIENIADFWETMWEFTDIIASKPYDQVIDDPDKMPGAEWFSGARLNFAENLLSRKDDHLALIFHGETSVRRQLTYAELYEQVRQVAASLRQMGIQKGDRIAAFMPNMPETVIAMLAAPLLLSALGIGLLVGMVQAATQIQEMTLSFIPKLLGVGAAIAIAGPWMLTLVIDWVRELVLAIPQLIG